MPPRSALPLVALLLAAACARPAAPPAAEFIVVAGDSSLWVRTGPDVGDDGIDLRHAPLLLARAEGRFYELFVTEEDYSFAEALFTSQTVWRRDLLSGDSAVVFGDTVVPRLAIAYARAHPHERPLGAEEPVADEPAVSATLEVTLDDVVGPYVTLESYADLHPEHGAAVHRARRVVVDVRSGETVTLAALVGDSAGARVEARGRAAFQRTRDSLRAGRDDLGRRAAEALGRFAFDAGSFALTRVDREPGVVFHVPGVSDEGDGWTLPLPAIRVPGGDWWQEASATLPAPQGRGGLAADGAAWEAPDGAVSLAARPQREGGRTALDLRDGARGRWGLGIVSAPVRRVYWLHAPAVAEAERAALRRAFVEAALYDGETRLVSAPAAVADRPVALRPAARATPAVVPPGRHATPARTARPHR